EDGKKQDEKESASPEGTDLVVSFEGFDGPIDLLLTLAREQKVDLSRLSILALAEQYLDYIASVRKLRLEIAADYLVMAAWLAYLKSRLLLPDLPEDESNPADMAEALKFQLLRLEAMQKASCALFEKPQLGTDFFLCHAADKMATQIKPVYYLPLYDLLSALGAPQRRRKPEIYDIKPTRLYSIEESLERLRRLLGSLPNWGTLQGFLPNLKGHGTLESKSAIASTFSAVLEMVKEGELELRQTDTFAPIYLKRSQKETLTEGKHDEK
ncbi:MAG TPA: segregation/condensation protein A, partial [Rhodospirillaceae bacterium]|nr:segregation/condensation protein A [Rhodospirillaceae bacterium]